MADAIIPDFLPKLIAVLTLVIISILNSISTRAGIHVQDVLTMIKVLAAVVISITGVVLIAQGTMKGNSFETVPFFDKIDTVTFGQYTMALYSGKKKKER